jgi:hypothetical protein
VNNTNLSNIRWENNTLVQHRGSVNAGILAIVYTDTSSGVSGGSLLPNSVFLINNLFVFDGVPPYGTVLDPNFAQTTNLIIDTSKKDPGFVDLAGTTAEAFALTASSPAVNAATAMPDLTLDYLNRAIPDPSGLPDIGAFEHGSADVSTPPGGIGGAAAGGGSGGMAGSGGTSGAAGASGSGGTTGSGGRAGAAAGVVSSMGCSCSLEPAQSRDALPLLATALAICALIRRAKPHADHPCRQ